MIIVLGNTGVSPRQELEDEVQRAKKAEDIVFAFRTFQDPYRTREPKLIYGTPEEVERELISEEAVRSYSLAECPDLFSQPGASYNWMCDRIGLKPAIRIAVIQSHFSKEEVAVFFFPLKEDFLLVRITKYGHRGHFFFRGSLEDYLDERKKIREIDHNLEEWGSVTYPLIPDVLKDWFSNTRGSHA